MSEEVKVKPAQSTSLMRRFVIYAAVLLVVFLLGFIPMWLKARECSGRLSEASHQLSLFRMQNT